MTSAVEPPKGPAESLRKLPLAASIVALVGLADSVYLTVHHYRKEPVPCGGQFDCGTVLNSIYSEIGGIPLAAYGAVAYFVAFSLALLTAFGRDRLWPFFGLQAILMSTVSAYLIYVQYAFINAWCQFCLLSAATSFTLYLLYLGSRFAGGQGRVNPIA